MRGAGSARPQTLGRAKSLSAAVPLSQGCPRAITWAGSEWTHRVIHASIWNGLQLQRRELGY